MKIMSWNVREVNTKLREVDSVDIDQIFGLSNISFILLPSIDSMRDIICCWNLATSLESSQFCHPRMIAIKEAWTSSVGPKDFLCIYAPNNSIDLVVFLRWLYLLCLIGC